MLNNVVLKNKWTLMSGLYTCSTWLILQIYGLCCHYEDMTSMTDLYHNNKPLYTVYYKTSVYGGYEHIYGKTSH